MVARKTAEPSNSKAAQRAKISQTDVPAYSIEEALRVPRAIADQYGYKPTKPLNVAGAMTMQPNSGPFRMLAGAALAYGLTTGGAFAPEVGLTPLGKRIVRPTAEGEDLLAKREALLKPRVIGEFLRKYADAPIPREDIAVNVLEEMGVPKERAKAVFNLIVAGAETVGLVKDIKGKRYISLDGVADYLPGSVAEAEAQLEGEDDSGGAVEAEPGAATPPMLSALPSSDAQKAQKRVYITHGKNRGLLDPIKKLLAFGDLEPVVSVERPSVSQPVSDKIMNEMRTCGAAIIHVDAELKLMDAEANEHIVLNPNVLMEIGAALALYGRRFVLLVRDGIKLPSNLQGLFEVRYSGDTLDGDATVRLLEAIRDIKNHAMPQRY